MTFHFERSWTIPISRDELWGSVADTRAYPRWWPWLRDYRPAPLEPGARAAATIEPPLPYRLRLGIEVVEAGTGRSLVAGYGTMSFGLPSGEVGVRIAGQTETVRIVAGQVAEF